MDGGNRVRREAESDSWFLVTTCEELSTLRSLLYFFLLLINPPAFFVDLHL